MNLNITYSKYDKESVYKFCEYLIPKIQQYFIDNLNPKKLIKFDKYLNGYDLIRFRYKKSIISTENILIGAIQNLIIKSYPNNYSIEIDPNITIPNTYAKFIDIVTLVDRGNLSLSPYPILTDTMDYIAANMKQYIEMYLREGN